MTLRCSSNASQRSMKNFMPKHKHIVLICRINFTFRLRSSRTRLFPIPQLRYQTALTGEYLHQVLNLGDATLVYQNASTRRVSGWNTLFGLPKAAEWAISMASVFLFGYNEQLMMPSIRLFITLNKLELAIAS